MRHFFYDSLKGFLIALVATLAFVVPTFAANLPAGYTELEYIESTGTQYIDTGITFNKDTDYGKIKTKLSIPDLSTAGYIGADGNINILWSGGKMYTGGASASSGYSINPDTSYNIQAEIESARSNRTITIDNTTLIGTPAVYTTKVAIFGGGARNGTVINLSKAKVYNFSIYKNNTLVFNGIPAKNSSNILGMYDLVSGQFFTNAGTGDFVAGPSVKIKIATTKYTEDAFAGLMTTLSEAITKVTNIVDDTVQQATEIGVLAETKQDRPDTDCPAGRKCLLIMGADNKPHWYLIQE